AVALVGRLSLKVRLDLVTNEIAVFVSHALNRTMKLRRCAGARFLVFVGDTVERFGEPVAVDRRRTATRPFGAVVAEHRIVTGIGRAVDARGTFGARSFLARKARLLLLRTRPP